MVTKSPGIEYEISVGKEKFRGVSGGSSLRIQIHLGKQKIVRCMGEGVNKANGESVRRVSPKKSRSGEDVKTSGEDTPTRYTSGEDVHTSGEDSYTPPSRSYRSSEDVDTGGGEN